MKAFPILALFTVLSLLTESSYAKTAPSTETSDGTVTTAQVSQVADIEGTTPPESSPRSFSFEKLFSGDDSSAEISSEGLTRIEVNSDEMARTYLCEALTQVCTSEPQQQISDGAHVNSLETEGDSDNAEYQFVSIEGDNLEPLKEVPQLNSLIYIAQGNFKVDKVKGEFKMVINKGEFKGDMTGIDRVDIFYMEEMRPLIQSLVNYVPPTLKLYVLETYNGTSLVDSAVIMTIEIREDGISHERVLAVITDFENGRSIDTKMTQTRYWPLLSAYRRMKQGQSNTSATK